MSGERTRLNDGSCRVCHKQTPIEGKTICSYCRDKRAEYKRIERAKTKEALYAELPATKPPIRLFGRMGSNKGAQRKNLQRSILAKIQKEAREKARQIPKEGEHA